MVVGLGDLHALGLALDVFHAGIDLGIAGLGQGNHLFKAGGQLVGRIGARLDLTGQIAGQALEFGQGVTQVGVGLFQGSLGHGKAGLGLGHVGHTAGAGLLTLLQGGQNVPVRLDVLLGQEEQFALTIHFKGRDDCIQGQGFGVVENPIFQGFEPILIQPDLAGGFTAVVQALGQVQTNLPALLPVFGFFVCIVIGLVVVGIRANTSTGIDPRIPAAF